MRGFVAGLVCAAIAAACGGAQKPDAHRADRVAGIRIEGNHALASDALIPALGLHDTIEDRLAIDPYQLALDTDRIRTAYLKLGYFEVQVTPKIEPGPAGQTVVFAVREGRRSMTAVEITGLPPELSREQVRKLIPLVDGAGFDYDQYDLAKEPLRALAANAGYAHAEIRASVKADPAAAIAHARYEIVPGPRCRFGAVTIRGTPHEVLVDAIKGRLHFAPGDPYSLTALTETRTELYALGRFSTVQLVPKLDGDTPVVDVAITVTESVWNEYHYGGGLGYEPVTYEARVRLGATWVPRAVPKLTLGADAQLAETLPHNFDLNQAEPKIRALISAQYFDLFRPRLTGRIEVGADDQTVEAYRSISEHVRVSLTSPLGVRWLQLRVGWVLEHATFHTVLDDNLNPLIVDALGLATQLRGAYETSLTMDLRDNPFDPRIGLYLYVPVSKGTRLAGGDLSYIELTPEIRGYLPLGATVLAARFRFGGIFGDVPTLDRYYSGGTSGQRGYSDRQLAPRVVYDPMDDTQAIESVVIGGAGLVETGVELRRLLGTIGIPIGGNVFLDGGDVTRAVDQLRLPHLAWAAGAGIWTRLGGLKLRVDVGYRLNRQTPGGVLDNLAPHIGIGDAY
ncbi:MAG TPA: BamA/TamA family outer membrane protein [Kofleriaceae bacterium]|nr:BamA/TamA family outer membrane protein [Kofleriaceae bacterium]